MNDKKFFYSQNKFSNCGKYKLKGEIFCKFLLSLCLYIIIKSYFFNACISC